jgi:hypothetical protein
MIPIRTAYNLRRLSSEAGGNDIPRHHIRNESAQQGRRLRRPTDEPAEPSGAWIATNL